MNWQKRVINNTFPTKSESKYQHCNAFFLFMFDIYASGAGPAHPSNFKSQCGPWAKMFAHPCSRLFVRCWKVTALITQSQSEKTHYLLCTVIPELVCLSLKNSSIVLHLLSRPLWCLISYGGSLRHLNWPSNSWRCLHVNCIKHT